MNTHSLAFLSTFSHSASIADNIQTGLDLSGDLTLEAWVRMASLPSSGANFGLITKYDFSANKRSYELTINSSGALDFRVSDDGTSDNGHYLQFTTSNALNAAQMYHVAVTFDISTETCIFYVNTIPVASSQTAGTSMGASLYNGDTDFVLGARLNSGTKFNFHNGSLDEVRVWNDVRTAQEIKDNIFNDVTGQTGIQGYWKLNNNYTDSSGNGNTLTGNNSPIFSTDVPFPTYTALNPVALGSTTLAEDGGLISYWELDGNSNDSKGSNNGTDTSISYVTGKHNQAADFNGTTSMVNVGSDNSLNLTSALTLSAWVNASGLGEGGFGRVFNRSTNESTTGFSIYTESTRRFIFSGFGNSSISTPVVAYDFSEFFHLVATLSGGTGRIYINGILVISGAVTISSASGAVGYIGNRAAGDRTFDGIIDDLAIFNRALTATEIFELYTGLNAIKKGGGLLLMGVGA